MNKVLIIIPSYNSKINNNLLLNLLRIIDQNTDTNMYELDIEHNMDEYGATKAINRGLRKAQRKRMDAVVIIDDMTWDDKNWLQKMQNIAYSSDDIYFVTFSDIRKRTINNTEFAWSIWGFSYIKRKCLDEIGLMDENFPHWGNEVDYGYRIFKHNKKIERVDINFATHSRVDETMREIFDSDTVDKMMQEAKKNEKTKWVYENERTK